MNPNPMHPWLDQGDIGFTSYCLGLFYSAQVSDLETIKLPVIGSDKGSLRDKGSLLNEGFPPQQIFLLGKGLLSFAETLPTSN